MNENVQIFLTIWGALLSSILAILTFIKYKKDYGTNIYLIAKSELPFEHLEFSISNKSKRPITLIEYNIGIGNFENSQTLIFLKKINEPLKLNESDIYSEKIKRIEIIDNVKNKNLSSREFQRLWLNIKLSTEKKHSEVIYINPKIIQKEYYKKAEQFIATDVFVGFEQKESKTYPIGINK